MTELRKITEDNFIDAFNLTARKLYESKDFEATGVEDDDEIEMVLMTD